MRRLAFVLYASIPLFAAGFFLAGRFISASYILAALWLILWLFSASNKQFKNCQREFGSLLILGGAFCALALVGVAASPYDTSLLLPRSAAQLIGLCIIGSASIAVASYLVQNKQVFVKLVRFVMIWLGLIGLLGVLQFVLNNVANAPVIDLEFLNFGEGGMWRPASQVGEMWRASSVAIEPSHLVRYLGMGIGIAAIRFGLIGDRARLAVEPFAPMWASLCIVGALLATLSFLGVMLVAVCVLSILILSKRLDWKIVVIVFLISAGGYLLISLMQSTSWEDFLEKAGTLQLVLGSEGDFGSVQTQEISALAVATNRLVAEASLAASPILGGGIGSHPMAYESLLPSSIYSLLEQIGLVGLNAEDAAGLLLRLVSEVGIAGTILYLTLVLGPVSWRSLEVRRDFMERERSGVAFQSQVLFFGLCGGYFAICAVAIFRYGAYFDPTLWFTLALSLSASATSRAPTNPVSIANPSTSASKKRAN